jgi:arginase
MVAALSDCRKVSVFPSASRYSTVAGFSRGRRCFFGLAIVSEFASRGAGLSSITLEPFTLIGVPIDSVGRDGGAELAPAVLRELGLAEALGGADAGDLAVQIRGEERDPETGILASENVLRTTATIRAVVAELVAAGERPFLAGGCCAELPGALAGARDALGEVGLVHLDGHRDLYDGETSPTGEAADMPISVALGLGPAAWVDAAGGASTTPERTALLGFHDPEEPPVPDELGSLTLLGAAELGAEEAGAVAARAASTLAASGLFWLHFDVDALDRDVFPATDYAMPGGLDWEETQAILTPLLASPTLIGASIACYNPEKDPSRTCGRALVEALIAASR